MLSGYVGHLNIGVWGNVEWLCRPPQHWGMGKRGMLSGYVGHLNIGEWEMLSGYIGHLNIGGWEERGMYYGAATSA